MLSCWEADPNGRPTFHDIKELLERHLSSASQSERKRTDEEAAAYRPAGAEGDSIPMRSMQPDYVKKDYMALRNTVPSHYDGIETREGYIRPNMAP